MFSMFLSHAWYHYSLLTTHCLWRNLRLRRELDIAGGLEIGADADRAREVAGGVRTQRDGEDVDFLTVGRAVADGDLGVGADYAGDAEGADAADYDAAIGLGAGPHLTQRDRRRTDGDRRFES